MTFPQAGKQMKLEGGTMAEDVVVGTGVKAKPGKHVGVYYVGRTAHNNKVSVKIRALTRRSFVYMKPNAIISDVVWSAWAMSTCLF